jgi:hypothetical protein
MDLGQPLATNSNGNLFLFNSNKKIGENQNRAKVAQKR